MPLPATALARRRLPPGRMLRGVRRAAMGLAGAAVLAGPLCAAPPGVEISNTAALDYLNAAGLNVTVTSNTVAVTTAAARSPASILLTRVGQTGGGAFRETVGPAACSEGGRFRMLADPVLLGGMPVDPGQPQAVSPTGAYNLGEPAFVRLEDSDQNLDFRVLDTVTVTLTAAATGDTEILRLTETGPDTGVFAGYIITAGGAGSSGDCVLQTESGSDIRVAYTDPADAADTAAATASIDPAQRVFESTTGSLVSGTEIEIVDAATGLPALVYGNDGVSRFPSTIVSGGTVTDSSGTRYAFAAGQYRFPVVPDGEYRLIVRPPPEYAAPSTASEDELQSLPAAPFALGPAAFGAPFQKRGGVSIAVDIPLDPQVSSLFLDKRTTTTVAAAGDFVRYELTIENTSAGGAATDLRIVDRLPSGTRFVAGSATMGGVSAPDPLVDADGRVMEFRMDSLAAGARDTISYVVEIVGGQADSELVNSAIAITGSGLTSNEATAAIRLREDLFRSTATLIGRVVEGDCSQKSIGEDQGVANVRVYLEDGRYAITDEGGRFHFEGLDPGTHVAQLDTHTVPAYYDVIGCAATPGFAGGTSSRFVKLSRGSLKRGDFYLRKKPRPEGRVDLELRSLGTDSAEQVAYILKIDGSGNVAIDNINVRFLLPEGVSYVQGSMRIDGEDLGEPRVQGPVLSLALDDRFGYWHSEIRFTADIRRHVAGELITRAAASFDSALAKGQETPVAVTKMLREPAVLENAGYVLDLKFAVLSDALTAADREQLDRLIAGWRGVSDIQISAVGHTDSQPIAARNRHLFADNYALSRARAMSAAFHIADALDVPATDVLVEGRGPDEPVASNATAEGRQANRRVEMVISGMRPSRPSFLEVTQPSSGTQATPTVGALPGEDDGRRRRIEIDPDAGMPASQAEPPLASLGPGIALLLPEPDFRPAIPATKISVQHAPRQTVKVYLNEKPVDPLTFDSTATNEAQSVAVSRWRGVDLEDGNNVIRVVVSNADGSRAKSLRREIHYAGQAIRGEIVEDRSLLVADGKTVPLLAVRLYDRSGEPSRAGTVGTYRVDAPYRSLWDVEDERRNDLVAIGTREPTYRVAADGIAYIELEPTTRSGEVTLTLGFGQLREQQLRTWLRPAARDWILVGFAEGSAAYDTLTKNMDAASAAGFEDGYVGDGRVAFFAKGSIRGDYLLTLAYDSARSRGESRNRFATEVDPTAYYPLFADASEQRFEAPSQRKLYVKLERAQFNALFGDFDTGLSVAELARYERRFNGFKTERRGAVLGYTAFAAESAQGFRRDELQGDGTSGLYRLSNAPVIVNSEKVRIEVRDRFDSAIVLSERRLSRFLDYNLDARDGTIFFKQPVPSRDLDFNPVYIVIEYETEAGGSEELVAGGRVSLRAAAGRLEVGATHVRDETAGADANLSGVDFRWQLDDATLFKAEYAESDSFEAGLSRAGVAHSLELEHNGEKVDVQAYIREVDEGFGLGQQSAADRGFRRLGIDLRAKFGEHFVIDGDAGWQQNTETEDIRNLARAQLRYERDAFSASLGVTHAEDRFEDGDKRVSDLGEVTIAQKLLKGRLTLRAANSSEMSGRTANADFPARFIVGADYRLMQGVDLVSEYEEASGEGIEATMTRVGVRATPWHRAQINTGLTNEVTEFGPRLFANVGLLQGFQLNERWTLDVGVDQTNTLVENGARIFDGDRALVSGATTEDFLAVHLGALYSAARWSANSRAEHRNSDTEERSSLLFGWYREPGAGHGLSAGLTLLTSENVAGTESVTADLRAGWAYRKAERTWSFLNRTDLVYEDAQTAAQTLRSWRLVNNFNANRRFGPAAELSLQYAFKYVRSEFDGEGYTGFTDLVGVDLRRGLRQRWDVGINTSVYHAYGAGVFDYGIGADVGFNLRQDMWLSLGYNLSGFHDSDFSEARYTAQGPYLRFSVKADQHALRRIAGR